MPALTILPPPQPDAIAEIIVGPGAEDEQYRPVPLHPFDPPVDEAGYGAWWRDRRWFDRIAQPEPRWPTKTESDEFEGSRRQRTQVDRLFGLWVTLESTFEDGQDGRSVIERVALSAIPAVIRALRADAIEIADLMGEQHPGADARWQDWAGHATPTGCAWAESRFTRLRGALRDRDGLLNTARAAIGHAFWLLSVLFAVRNRRAHEAWQPEPADGIMLDRLEVALRHLLVSLLDARDGQTEWGAAGRLLQVLDGAPPALLDELGV